MEGAGPFQGGLSRLPKQHPMGSVIGSWDFSGWPCEGLLFEEEQ